MYILDALRRWHILPRRDRVNLTRGFDEARKELIKEFYARPFEERINFWAITKLWQRWDNEQLRVRKQKAKLKHVE